MPGPMPATGPFFLLSPSQVRAPVPKLDTFSACGQSRLRGIPSLPEQSADPTARPGLFDYPLAHAGRYQSGDVASRRPPTSRTSAGKLPQGLSTKYPVANTAMLPVIESLNWTHAARAESK